MVKSGKSGKNGKNSIAIKSLFIYIKKKEILFFCAIVLSFYKWAKYTISPFFQLFITIYRNTLKGIIYHLPVAIYTIEGHYLPLLLFLLSISKFYYSSYYFFIFLSKKRKKIYNKERILSCYWQLKKGAENNLYIIYKCIKNLSAFIVE